MGNPLIDEKGHKYGALTVLELSKDKDGRTAWLCLCDCGNTKIVRGPDLRKGKITSCGCHINRRNKQIIDIIGNIYNDLKVIQREDSLYDSKNKKNVYKCQCLLCGNYCYVKRDCLVKGSTTNCGCNTKKLQQKAQMIDETGNKYGELIVLEPDFGNVLKWKCQCSCGNIVYVPGKDLRSGNTKSCGCKSGYSYEVKAIAVDLQKLDIPYQQEYSFPDLRGELYPLRFDFALLKNNQLIGLIEYNGQQHYYAIDYFGGIEAFNKQQEHDNRKIAYCEEHNIPLLILKYTSKHQDNMEAILDFYHNVNN